VTTLAPRAGEIAKLHARLRLAASTVRALPVAERAAWVAAAAERLLDATAAPGREVRDDLLRSTGLTPPVIEHGLRTTLGLFSRDALLALHAGRDVEHATQSMVVVLSGNLFSAAARPMLLPILCGCGVLAKASSSDDVLPRHLMRALASIDARLGAACEVVTFAHADGEPTAALLQGAELVSVYGSDETVAAISERLADDTRLLAHGHGMGVMFVAADALSDASLARDIAQRAALDVAAYDQRGCLSPHAVIVQQGGAVDAHAFAGLLGDALQTLALPFARGALAPDAAAAQMQWRGVAAAVGELHCGSDSAVSYEAHAPLRISPGYRNISVHDCADVSGLRARLLPLGRHLKALGVAGSIARHELSSLAPYVCEIGAMQTPPLDAALDGLHPLAGFG